ncbi:MAG: hypothetical protein ABJG78_05895 [Cyclobacteriaceae bacterium]
MAQESNLSYAEQLLALELEMDSLSIFNFLDSVLLQNDVESSQLSVRVGMTSSVTSAGRDYDINQTGYSAGLSYFHKSGGYLDLSGYWNSDVTPTYNPTILSGGYLGSLSPKWSYSLDYEHWFFNPKDSSDNSLTNSFGSSLSYDFKKGYLSVDYSFLFGKETSHRFIGSLTGTIKIGELGLFKNVSIFPTASMMAGNGNVTTLRITTEQVSDEFRFTVSKFNQLSELTDAQREQLKRFIARNDQIPRDRKNRLFSLITLYEEIDPTDEELAQLNLLVENGVESEEFVDGQEFGILNYSFSLPISLSTNRFSILLSYTYSIPIQLSSEIFEVEPLGYFGASISYRIPY